MKLGRYARMGLFVGVGLAASACERPEGERSPSEPFMVFDTGVVSIETETDTFTITAELARTDAQRAYGLMERPSLPQEHGMLFLYPSRQPGDAGFWMYRTLIPLDIAFLDGEGRIVSIRRMEPCASPNPQICPHYRPGEAYVAALEVNRGFFDRHGVGLGDRVRLVDGSGDAP